MNVRQFLIGAILLFVHVPLYAQLTIPLKEVVLTDRRLYRYSMGYRNQVLADSVLQARTTWAGILADESLGFVRENGRGMVASLSLRGTSAGHTAVIWNGININSPLNGQVDLNNFILQPGDRPVLRMGGGSVLFGSGAIGGSVHLDQALRFQSDWTQRLDASYGSFESRFAAFSQKGGSRNWSVNWGVTAQDSENDYPIPGTSVRNENGRYEFLSWTFNAAHRFSNTSRINLYHMGNTGNRQLSSTLLAPSQSEYSDAYSRTQLSLETETKRYEIIVRLAHLFETYTFRQSQSGPISGNGSSHTLLGRYEGTLRLGRYWSWQHFAQIQGLSALGRNINSPDRTDLSISSLFAYTRKRLTLSGSVRKEITTEFESPVLFALQAEQLLGKHWKLKTNASRNFRAPTFNDLFWDPGGNPKLEPENSVQWELGLVHENDRWNWEAHAYWIRSRNLIRWLPGSTPDIWSPLNTDRVWIQGFETTLRAELWKTRVDRLSIHTQYGYTRSLDRNDMMQLAYTPVHQGRLRMDWVHGNFRLHVRQVYTGSVLTQGIEQLPGWVRTDFGAYWSPVKTRSVRYTLGIELRNLQDRYYEFIAFRPMPGRNLTSKFTLNF